MNKATDALGCPLEVGDTVICCKGGQGDTGLFTRDILDISVNGDIKLRGFSKTRSSDEVMSIKPHREMYPEYFI